MNFNLKQICIIGIGRFGNALIEELSKKNINILAIDNDEKNLKEIDELVNSIIKTDAKSIKNIKEIGVQNFETVVVSTVDNIEIVSILKELKVKNIIAKAKDKRHEKILRQIGATTIIRPEVDGGIRTALMLTNTIINKYTDQINEISDGYIFCSAKITNQDYFKRLDNLNLIKKGIVITLIERDKKFMLPKADIKITNNDKLYIVGKMENVSYLVKDFVKEDKK